MSTISVFAKFAIAGMPHPLALSSHCSKLHFIMVPQQAHRQIAQRPIIPSVAVLGACTARRSDDR